MKRFSQAGHYEAWSRKRSVRVARKAASSRRTPKWFCRKISRVAVGKVLQEGSVPMRMENRSYEARREDLVVSNAVCLEGAAPRGVQIEAHEFERLLRRAMEALSARERSALVKRSRLTNAADAAAL